MAFTKQLLLAAMLAGAPLAGLPLATSAAEVQAVSPAQQLNALAERYYDEAARFEPLAATINGDSRFDDQLPMTIVPAVRARQYAMFHEVRDELAKIDRSKLAGTDLVTFDCLAFELATALSFESFPDYLLAISHMDSVPVLLAIFGSGQASQPIATIDQYRIYLKRLSALDEWLSAATLNMREGIKAGVVQPKALIVSLLPQLKKLAEATPATSDYSAPVRNCPASFSAGEKARLKGQYLNTVGGEVLPALRKFSAFVENEYLPAARSSSGWSALPEGPHWYRAAVRAQTTTDLSAEEIHRIGLSEMRRIRAEFVKLGDKLGYKGDPMQLRAWLATQPAVKPFKTDEEVLQAYRALNDRIKPQLPALFASMPKSVLEIRAEPEISKATASNHYSAPADGGKRPGIFWAVIPNPLTFATTGMTSLFLHEGQPGHHFQLAKQQELAIPKFRQFGVSNAYVEGWALYAETLGREMGLYDDPVAYAGHLGADMTRAARLVVDTGLHAKGWTREQPLAFLMEQNGDSEATAKNSTERYMAWPAQALGYKIGALKIMELRTRAEKALGAKFSLARFHDAVLAEGAVPLSVLEARINAWIAVEAQ